MTMKKIFIATLAALAFAGCNNEKKAENVAEANATETVASVSSSDIAVVDVIFVVNESEIAKTEGVALRNKMAKTEEKFAKKDQNIQKEMQQLAEKYQKGLITTRDHARELLRIVGVHLTTIGHHMVSRRTLGHCTDHCSIMPLLFKLSSGHMHRLSFSHV